MHLFETSMFFWFPSKQQLSFGSLQLSDMQNWGNLLSCIFCLRTKRGGKETRVGHFSPLLPFLLLSTQTLICLKTVNPAFCFPSYFSEKGRFLVGGKKLFFLEEFISPLSSAAHLTPRGIFFPKFDGDFPTNFAFRYELRNSP